jgi:hypothetical protein
MQPVVVSMVFTDTDSYLAGRFVDYQKTDQGSLWHHSTTGNIGRVESEDVEVNAGKYSSEMLGPKLTCFFCLGEKSYYSLPSLAIKHQAGIRSILSLQLTSIYSNSLQLISTYFNLC